MKSKRPTREDVAREAGTSVAVVTYTVNNGPRPVAEETRKRVLAAIDKLGYSPNHAARILASGKSGNYGLVLPNITNPFIAEIAHAFQAKALEQGKLIIIGDSADDPERERRLLQSLIGQQVDGVIYMGTVEKLALDVFDGTGIPAVVLTYADSDSKCPSVRIDETRAIFELTTHLLRHGYDHIDMMTGPEGMENSFVRAQGWCNAIGSDLSSPHISWCAYSRIAGYQWLTDKYAQGHVPQAVVAGNERQALGVMAACSDLHIRIPTDLALVALNGSSDTGYSVPSLTAVRQPWGEMAELAFHILSDTSLNRQPRSFASGFDIVFGESCGCRHAGTRDRALLASWATPSSDSLDSVAGVATQSLTDK